MKCVVAKKQAFAGSFWKPSRWGFSLLGLFCSLAVAQNDGLSLETMWEKNVYATALRAPLIGSVAEDGSLCLAMSQGREAVIFNADGSHRALLRADEGSISNMVSITDLGYDAEGKVFWIWSELVHKISRWDVHGNHLGTTSVAPEVSRPAPFGKRKVYLRRPDQGSPFALFSYTPEFDEEIMIWQPRRQTLIQQSSFRKPSYVLGNNCLAVRDGQQLTLVHLNEFRDDWSLPLPEAWFDPPPGNQGELSIQSRVTKNHHLILRGGNEDQFWVFLPNTKGLGYDYARYDGKKGVLQGAGMLEDVPIAIDSQHLYFVDVLAADILMLRKVRMTPRK